jgi:hypothetical protein
MTMTTNLATPGLILKGRTPSNLPRRTKVWAIHPTNPNRVLLWSKGGKFSWAHVSSLAVNYEPADDGEPTWADPDPRRAPPADPLDAPKPATPVETVATAPEPVPTVDTSADEDEGAVPEDVPAPSPPPAPSITDEESMAIVLHGDDAVLFRTQLMFLNNAARMTGGQPLTPAALATTAVARLVAGLMGGVA